MSPTRVRHSVLCASLILVPPSTHALAQNRPPTPKPPDLSTVAPRPNQVFHVRRAQSTIKVDARLEEPAWRDADVIPLPIEITPRDNVPAEVETACHVTFDAEHLYVGCEAFDPDPASIRAHVTNRDNIFGNHDRISFLVDPFNDSRRGFVFEVSALGVQGDLAYDEQTDFDASWDGIWSSAGRITNRGFIIEAAIPFKTLRFPPTGGAQTWRFWINRMRPRSELVVMRTNTRHRDDSCQLCQAHLLRGFTGMHPGMNIEVIPTITGRHSTSRTESFPDGPLVNGPLKLDPGLDARWSITSNIALNATVNPDFSQVEADAPQLAVNNPFALRFTEKRPFFLEGADLFRTPIDVVFTRTVSDPIAGAKLTGKTGPHAVGALVAVDDVNSLLFPGPFASREAVVDERVTSAMLRYRRDVGAQNSLGMVYAGRFAGGDYRNHVGGLDLFLQPASTLTWSAQVVASETRYASPTAAASQQPAAGFSGQAARSLVRYRGRALHTELETTVHTRGFRADAGFVPQADYRGTSIWVAYDFRKSGGWFTLLQPGVGASRNTRTSGALISEGTWVNVYYEGPWQSTAWANPELRRESFDGVTHELVGFWTGFDVRPRRWLRLGVSGNVGDQIDFRNGGKGDVLRVSPSADVQIGRHVEVASRHSLQRLEKTGVQVFSARVDELKAVFNLTARAFVRTTVQYRRTDRNPATNPGLTRRMEESLFSQLLFSYKVNPLTVLFVGLTDDRAGFDEGMASRVELTARGFTFFFKMGYAWRP